MWPLRAIFHSRQGSEQAPALVQDGSIKPGLLLHILAKVAGGPVMIIIFLITS